jgi:hypothetical protein
MGTGLGHQHLLNILMLFLLQPRLCPTTVKSQQCLVRAQDLSSVLI